MFSKLKQFKDMRAQAKNLQSVLATETVNVEELGGKIKLSVDGNLSMQSVSIDPTLLSAEQAGRLETGLKDGFNSAIKKVQRIMAAKLREEGGMDMFKN